MKMWFAVLCSALALTACDEKGDETGGGDEGGGERVKVAAGQAREEPLPPGPQLLAKLGEPQSIKFIGDAENRPGGIMRVRLQIPVPKGWATHEERWGTSFSRGEVAVGAELWCADCGVEEIRERLGAMGERLSRRFTIEEVSSKRLGEHGLMVLRHVIAKRGDWNVPSDYRRERLNPKTFELQCHHYDASGEAVVTLYGRGPLEKAETEVPLLEAMCQGVSWEERVLSPGVGKAPLEVEGGFYAVPRQAYEVTEVRFGRPDEIYLRQPLIVGGIPVDPDYKVKLTAVDDRMHLSRFWLWKDHTFSVPGVEGGQVSCAKGRAHMEMFTPGALSGCTLKSPVKVNGTTYGPGYLNTSLRDGSLSVHSGILGEDTTFDGIACRAGHKVSFSSLDGTLSECTLAADATAGPATFAAGSEVFVEKGVVDYGELKVDTEIAGIPCKAGERVGLKEGKLSQCYLAREHTTPEGTFQAGTRVWFNEDGTVRQATVSTPHTIQAQRFEAGDKLKFKGGKLER